MNTALRLQNRIAVVTGSTTGIGLAIAEKLAQDGAKVIISSRNKNNVDEALTKLHKQGLDVTGIVCHVANKENRKRLVEIAEKLGGLDILVQCAGVNPFVGSILDCSEECWDKVFETNIKSSFMLTKEVFHLLKESKFGRVIYNGSLSSYLTYERLGAYPVAKTALLSLTRQVALHLGHYNATCNCVVPGLIDTKFGAVLKNDKQYRLDIERLAAIKRAGKPEEVSGLVAFLASDEASFITGEAIVISGGYGNRL